MNAVSILLLLSPVGLVLLACLVVWALRRKG